MFARPSAEIPVDAKDLHLQISALQTDLAQAVDEQAEAVATARADGFAAGLAQARAEIAQALLTTETAIAKEVAGLNDRFLETERRMAIVATEVALAAGSVLAATALDADPTGAIDQAIGRVLAQTGYREALRVHVAPSLLPAVEALIASRASLEQRSFDATVHADPLLRPGDVNILWDRGGLALDADARMLAVRAALGLVPA